MVAPLLQDSPKEHQARVQAPATSLDPKLTKVRSTPDYAPSTGLANVAESGRRLDFVSNRLLAGSGKYRHGRHQQQKVSVRKPRVGKVPPTVRVKRTVAATLAAIKVPPSTPPISPARRPLQLPYLLEGMECLGHRHLSMYDALMYSIFLRLLRA